MPREKFQTLTEQMFYILLCLQNECCGTDIMTMVGNMTGGRIQIGPGTLYTLLEKFLNADMIEETKVEGRKRSYRITGEGRSALNAEFQRLTVLADDYRRFTAYPEAALAVLKEGGTADETQTDRKDRKTLADAFSVL